MTDPIIGGFGGTVTTAPLYAGSGEVAPGAVPVPASAAVSAHASPQPAAELSAIATTLNQRAQELQTSLHFQVDHVTGQLVISVIDTQDQRVLLQIPGQEALAIAQSLERIQMQLMKQSA